MPEARATVTAIMITVRQSEKAKAIFCVHLIRIFQMIRMGITSTVCCQPFDHVGSFEISTY